MIIKLKAVSFIIILIFTSFSLVDFTKAEQNACCEKTLEGDYCQYTDVNNCDPTGKTALVNCEQTSYCNLGCCFNSDDGRCFKNTPRTTCNIEGGTWEDNPDCEIAQCSKGCCILGTESFFVTETRCKKETSNFPDAKMIYDSSITNELECIDKSRSQEMGCCVSEDDCSFTTREGCNVATNVNIEENKTRPGFYKDMLCSNDKLSCGGCAKQQYTGCVGEDVYWFDSCGNKENIYSSNRDASYNNGFVLKEEESCNANSNNLNDVNCGNCDYSKGTLCGNASRNVNLPVGNLICKSTACKDTYEDSVSPNAGDDKKGGESWCVYDSQVGHGKDLVGSRHYRHLCINNEEITEQCRDYREEICIQGVLGEDPSGTFEAFGVSGDFIESACRDNRWENCYNCNSADNPKKCCEDIATKDCFWANFGIGNGGVCIPEVPPGLKFWSDDVVYAVPSTTRGEAEIPTGEPREFTPSIDDSVCSQASIECEVVWVRGGLGRIFGSDYECVQNCDCTTHEWIVAGNNLCRSLGDCGAYYNVLGKSTMDGYSNTASNERAKDDGLFFDGAELRRNEIGDFSKLMSKPKEEEIPRFGKGLYWGFGGIGASALLSYAFGGPFKAAITGGIGSFIRGVGGAIKPTSTFGGAFSSSARGVYGSPISFAKDVAIEHGTIFTKGNIIPGENAKFILKDSAGKVIANPKITAGESFSVEKITNGGTATLKSGPATAGEGGVTGTAVSSGTANIMSWVNTALWIYTISQIVDIVFKQEERKTYKVGCGLWQPPTGGEDCEKCNEDPNKPCSLYKCKSLGQLCSLINQGTSEERCVNVHPNDVNSPIINPMPDVLSRNLTLRETREEGINGYRINEEIEAFTPINLGIKTDEPAQCKFDKDIGMRYDDMTSFFGDQLYTYNHTILFSLPSELADEEVLRLTNGGQHTIYIKCQDATGNRNERDYFVKFRIKAGPDLTAPVIEATSIQNNAFVPAGVNETSLSVYVNEPSECKWSIEDTDFEVMQNALLCSTNGFSVNSIYYGLYECKTTLTNIKVGENNFYIRCKDQPNKQDIDRNVNEQSFLFNLKGTIPLQITDALPTGTIFDAELNLEVMTANGAENGRAVCGFSEESDVFENMIEFLETNSNEHVQPLELDPGDYAFFIACRDAAGNEDSTTLNFNVDVDLSAPALTQIYKDTAASLLHIETDEISTCEYSTSEPFNYGEGTLMTNVDSKEHEASLTSDTYYVRCVDIYNNELSAVIYV